MKIKALLAGIALVCSTLPFGFNSTNAANIADQVTVQSSQTTVYVTPYGRKFHRGDCYHIRGHQMTSMSRSAAVNRGYGACKTCRP